MGVRSPHRRASVVTDAGSLLCLLRVGDSVLPVSSFPIPHQARPDLHHPCPLPGVTTTWSVKGPEQTCRGQVGTLELSVLSKAGLLLLPQDLYSGLKVGMESPKTLWEKQPDSSYVGWQTPSSCSGHPAARDCSHCS